MVKWALKVELYASCYLEMLKAPVVKIELRFDRKNRSPIEKIKVLFEALYQEYETDFLNVADPFRRQRKFFKGGLNLRKIFLRYEYSRFRQLSAGT